MGAGTAFTVHARPACAVSRELHMVTWIRLHFAVDVRQATIRFWHLPLAWVASLGSACTLAFPARPALPCVAGTHNGFYVLIKDQSILLHLEWMHFRELSLNSTGFSLLCLHLLEISRIRLLCAADTPVLTMF